MDVQNLSQLLLEDSRVCNATYISLCLQIPPVHDQSTGTFLLARCLAYFFLIDFERVEHGRSFFSSAYINSSLEFMTARRSVVLGKIVGGMAKTKSKICDFKK